MSDTLRFKAGDLVRIREWEDMAAEFGIRSVGEERYIDCSAGFMWDMRHLCGMEFTIVDPREYDGFVDYAWGVDGFQSETVDKWTITADMIELVEDDDGDDAQEDGAAFLDLISHGGDL